MVPEQKEMVWLLYTRPPWVGSTHQRAGWWVCLAMQLARSGGRRLAAEALAQSDGRVSHGNWVVSSRPCQFAARQRHS